MMLQVGKSKAQDALLERLRDAYPLAYVKDEVYIGDLIEDMGYTIKEMTSELGHKPHRMFVDIVMRDSERIVAFEYHGEQHYSRVGNMTKTTQDLVVNKRLDDEKAQILERIGIPLVTIPFDMYIDEEVIESLVSESTQAMTKVRSEMSTCGECGRMFPPNRVVFGVCKGCKEKIDERAKADDDIDGENEEGSRSVRRSGGRRRGRESEKPFAPKGRLSLFDVMRMEAESGHLDGNEYDPVELDESDVEFNEQEYDADSFDSESDWEKEKKRRAAEKRERDKERRKEAYQRYKQSPQYAERKRREKEARKEAYQRRKEEMKRRKENGLL